MNESIMKRILFLAALFSMLVAAEGCSRQQQKNASERFTPEQESERMVERLNEELQLTEKQQNDLKVYFTDSFKKRKEAFEKNKESREELRDMMKKEREATDAQLKKVLTEEQYDTYKENERKRREERGGRRRQSGSEQPPMERRFPR